MRIVKVQANNYNMSTGQYESEPVVLDVNITPFEVTYFSNSSGATIEVSVADPYPVENGKFVEQTNYAWFSAPTSFPNGGGFLGQPFTAIRIVDPVSSPPSELTVIQAGIK